MSSKFEFTAGVQAENGAHQNPFSDPEETRVLYATLDSFRYVDSTPTNFCDACYFTQLPPLSVFLHTNPPSQYRQAAHYNVTHLRWQSFYSLRSAHVDLLSESPLDLPEVFDQVDDAIDCNADLCDAILESGLSAFGIHPDNEDWKGCAKPSDMDKARSTVRQFYRDWTAGGSSERDATYTPILAALEKQLPAIPASKRHRHRILVPGAGLGRLVFDLCCAGYSVEGNEISYHQLLASNYALNCTARAGQHTIYPWALNFSNHLTRNNQLRSYEVPDIHPATALDVASEKIQAEVGYGERMSMMAGDFCVLYQQLEYQDVFDAVTTCYFIDTAPNVIAYIEAIKHCLKSGGIWVNLGPLLWHFEAAPTPAEMSRNHQTSASEHQTNQSNAPNNAPVINEGIAEPGNFELTDSEVISLVSRLGFDLVEHQPAPTNATGYIQDPASMLQNLYRPSFWIMRKG